MKMNSLFKALGLTMISELNAQVFNSHCTYAVRHRKDKCNQTLQNIKDKYISKADTKPYFLHELTLISKHKQVQFQFLPRTIILILMQQ